MKDKTQKICGWQVRDGIAADEEQFVGFKDILSMNSVSICANPFGSLSRSNTLEGTPPTLPWYWSDPTVVLVRPYRGIGSTLPWYWSDPSEVFSRRLAHRGSSTGSFCIGKPSQWGRSPALRPLTRRKLSLLRKITTRDGGCPSRALRNLSVFRK